MTEPYAIVRHDGQWLACDEPQEVVVANGADAFAALDHISGGGFWAGACSYDLGRTIERVEPHADDDLALPDLAFVRFGRRRVCDAPPAAPVQLGAGRSSLTRDEHREAVERVHELLRDGECYQVNLTRRIAFDTAPDPRALFGSLTAVNPAPFASVIAFDDFALVSASPELFLRVDGRSVETHPIKGTHADAVALATSAKDHAENVMIVDLARNDLGRVCVPGSIGVDALCAIEAHPGLHHLVSRVHGRRRDNVGLGALFRATFPPASVTGAPKPRVLRAIEELEPVRRDFYCGALGWIDADADRAELAVAIRTFTIARGQTFLGVGGGIVADSDADAEWRETELKAARLLRAAGARERHPVVSW